jgi:hypothetical protein
MIVNIAAWLYLINGALTLCSLSFSPFKTGGAGNLTTLVFAGLYIALGVGLLQRKSWARWLALGSSFLGWTFGALLLLVFIAAMFFGGSYLKALGASFGGLVMIIALLFLLMWLAGVVINFKLFWYLCSQDGCDEFDAPYGSASTVVGSTATWIGIMVCYTMMSTGTSLSGLAALTASAGHQQSGITRRDRDNERDNERDRAQMQARMQRDREAREAARREQMEVETRAHNEAELARAAAAESYREQRQASQMPVEAPVQERAPAQQEQPAGEPSGKRILKCRDSAGSVTFTQGYCPPGTHQVEMPAAE